jgi:hypothetical protein
MFYRWRTINRNRYLYREERYRDPVTGKVKSRSTIVGRASSGGKAAAMERYRDVLRDVAYRKPIDGLAQVARAREEYHRWLDAARQGFEYEPATDMEAFSDRTREKTREAVERRDAADFSAEAKAAARSAEARARGRYHNLRDQIREANAKQRDAERVAKGYHPRGTPTDEEEVAAANAREEAQDRSAEQYAEYAESMGSTTGEPDER